MRYPNPFEGKPAPIDLRAFAHFPPDVYLQLRKIPKARAAFTSIGKEDLFKRLQRAQRNNHVELETLKELSDCIDGNHHEFVASITAAITGDPDAVERVGKLGDWGAFLHGANTAEHTPTYAEQYLLALERLSYTFLKLWQSNDHKEALAVLEASPLANQIFGVSGLRSIVPGQSLDSMLCLRSAGAMESYLGLMSAFWIETSEGKGADLAVQMRTLLPDALSPDLTPLKRLAHWLYSNAAVTSWAQLSRNIEISGAFDSNAGVSKLLKAWRSGKRIPDEQNFVSAVQGAGKHKLVGASQMHAFAVHLNFLGWFDEQMRLAITPLAASHPEVTYPWPSLLHDFSSFEEWAPARFESWCLFHQSKSLISS